MRPTTLPAGALAVAAGLWAAWPAPAPVGCGRPGNEAGALGALHAIAFAQRLRAGPDDVAAPPRTLDTAQTLHGDCDCGGADVDCGALTELDEDELIDGPLGAAPPSSGDWVPLTELGAAGLIDPVLASGEKQGYRFRLEDTGSGWVAVAEPTEPGVTGHRRFAVDESGRLYEEGPLPSAAEGGGGDALWLPPAAAGACSSGSWSETDDRAPPPG